MRSMVFLSSICVWPGVCEMEAVSSRVRCEDSRGRFENFLGSTYRLPDPGPGVSDSLVLEKE